MQDPPDDPAPVDKILELNVERRKILSEVETMKAERKPGL